ncbi:MAG TPA: AAA family ATPase [Candidatus Nitrosocosmicus sp.]|nr:AAA family ATPase [Candidatus Nitrosocosmicus sp.]
MRKSFPQFVQSEFHNFSKAIFNVFIFLPYFFSVNQFFRTLFSPWKNLISKKTQTGFTFQDLISRITFNIVSRGMGAMMRTFILIFYFITLICFMIVLPLLTFLFVMLVPFRFFIYTITESEQEKKERLKSDFIKSRLLKQENLKFVEAWYENYYHDYIEKSAWYELGNLFSTPPLGRDWTMGYTPTLDKFSDELTMNLSHFKGLIGREKEIKQIEQILSKTEETNVLVVGEEGVGKHTVIQGLAQRIYVGKTNIFLAYKRIIHLDMEQIISQASDVSQKEQILKDLLNEATNAKNIIILIDNFDKYIRPGSPIDLSGLIEPYAKSNALQFIGITTPFAYQKFLSTNDKINRLFEKVDVFEIEIEEAKTIMMNNVFEIEKKLQCIIPYESILEAVEKSNFYITDIPFPEKALVLLDRAAGNTVQIKKQQIVMPDTVDEVLSQKTHVPVKLDASMKDKLLNLEPLMKDNILFQDSAVTEVSTVLRKAFVIASTRKKPLASFLFLGSTGVGKTETAKILAQTIFGSQKELIRFDMSLYQRTEDIQSLIGDQNSGNPGLLSKAIREKPYGVLLLDEIEKADKNLLNIFLTLLDEGYFTDGFGKRVDGKNLIIIGTSNAGSDYLVKLIQQNETENLNKKMMNHIIEQKIFAPEFLNRFDGVITFNPLNKDGVRQIGIKMLDLIGRQIYASYKINIDVAPETLSNLIDKHYDPTFGARNLQRLIQYEIEDKISKLILANQVKEGDTISL